MVVNEKTGGRGREKKRERKKTRDPRTTIDPIGLKVWGRSSRKSQATFTNRCQSFAKNIFLDRKESPPSSIGTLRLRLDRAWPCATDKTWTEVLAERFQTRHPWSEASGRKWTAAASPETSPPPRHFPPIAPISSPCLNKFYRFPRLFRFPSDLSTHIYICIFFHKEGRNVISFSLNNRGFSLFNKSWEELFVFRFDEKTRDRRSLAFCSARGMFTSDPFFRASARAKIHFPRSRRPVSRAAKVRSSLFLWNYSTASGFKRF